MPIFLKLFHKIETHTQNIFQVFYYKATITLMAKLHRVQQKVGGYRPTSLMNIDATFWLKYLQNKLKNTSKGLSAIIKLASL